MKRRVPHYRQIQTKHGVPSKLKPPPGSKLYQTLFNEDGVPADCQIVERDSTVHIKGGEDFFVVKPDETVEQAFEKHKKLMARDVYRVLLVDGVPTGYKPVGLDEKVDTEDGLGKAFFVVLKEHQNPETNYLKLLKKHFPEHLQGEADRLIAEKTGEIGDLEEKREEAVKKLEKAQAEHIIADRLVRALSDMKTAWGYTFGDPQDVKIVLPYSSEFPTGLHRLEEALKHREIVSSEQLPEGDLGFGGDVRTIRVGHDWYTPIKDQAEATADSEFMLPFPRCAFEFRAGNRHVIACMGQNEGEPPRGTVYYETNYGDWLVLGTAENTLWWRQVKAICIMLDVEIAVTDFTPAPEKLNAKRLKAGKAPLRNFYSINLAKRYRTGNYTPREDGQGPAWKVRWHLRRGHWFHFKSDRYSPELRGTKVWKKWTMVGDPELGAITKDYKVVK